MKTQTAAPHPASVRVHSARRAAEAAAARRVALAAAKPEKAHKHSRRAVPVAAAPAKPLRGKALRAERLAEARAAKEAQLAATQTNARRRAAQSAASARLSRHAERAAALQAAHAARLLKLQQAAAAKRGHEIRLAAAQAKALKRHNERLARIAALDEAQRQRQKDKNSKIVHVAASSGLPIWQGNAYAAQVPVKVVTVDLNDPRIKVSALLARNGIGTSEPFTQMINRAHPSVAVTGTFFSLDNLRPVGDIVVNGSLAYFGGMGTALAITPDNHADMITVPWGHHHDWAGYDTVVACGPRLLSNRQVVLDPRMEHFKDRHMLAPNSRIAVGITGHNQLVFCMTREPIYLGRLAKVMQSLGCKEAMNLDAGTSTGFYCNGNLMARPGRWLTNAIVVFANRKRHDSEEREAGANALTEAQRRVRLAAGQSLVAQSAL